MWFIIVVSTGSFKVILLGTMKHELLFEENQRLLFGSH